MRRGYRTLPLLAILAAVAGLTAANFDGADGERRIHAVASGSPQVTGIVVRGRLEPSEGIFAVAAFSLAPTAALGAISVAEGSRVHQGELLATLRSREQALAAVDAARAAVVVAERRLDVTRHPYKDAEIAAQRATVQARLADLNLAEAQIRRSGVLRQRGIVSDEANDVRAAEMSRASANLDEARARLQAATEVPKAELLLAQAEIAAARARLVVAEQELALTEIRAPSDGVVLKILAKSGELVSNRPIMEIGDIGRPKVIAEVDERLVPRIRAGQPVQVSVRGLDSEWSGTVSRIGSVVLAQNRPPADTVTDRGGRIVEVEAILADPAGLPRIAGLELLVRIEAP